MLFDFVVLGLIFFSTELERLAGKSYSVLSGKSKAVAHSVNLKRTDSVYLINMMTYFHLTSHSTP